jgi:hypothetical protein
MRAFPHPARVQFLGLVLGGCAASSAPPPAAPAPSDTAPAIRPPPAEAAADDARGGRLYDNWYAEKKLGEAFVPDDAKTPALDGKGGPNGNGTLANGSGEALPNTGHGYRLKNFFGWDLRGEAGIYGSSFQKKAPHAVNLLEDPRPTGELVEWLLKGDATLPAFGAVLDERDRRDLGAFLEKLRSHALPQPGDVFSLSKDAPKNYVLRPGADAPRGREYIGSSCANCHGKTGTDIAIDETESLGTLARTGAYEVWFKILNGHPGSGMGRQVPQGAVAEQTKVIRDVLAALCDRTAFPPQKNGKDVPNGDARCGASLK